jgi:hypothetical protein
MFDSNLYWSFEKSIGRLHLFPFHPLTAPKYQPGIVFPPSYLPKVKNVMVCDSFDAHLKCVLQSKKETQRIENEEKCYRYVFMYETPTEVWKGA